MMQNDQGVGRGDDGEALDDFQKLMRQLEQMKSKPLFTPEEEEEVKEDDDLFDEDDEDDAESLLRRQKQRDQESKKVLFDDDDDDYYDDYSEEEQEGKKSVQGQGNADSKNVMHDFIKGKTASHRFKSRFDDFADDGDEETLSSGSRKLRKNDSIKVISTPNGKVGIVYKVEPKSAEDDKAKKGSENQSGTLDVQPKITPVITADGKVALLYRGASDNSETFRNKFEPITNKDILTQLIDNNSSNNKSTTSSSSGNANNSIKNITTLNSIYSSNYDSYDSFNRNSNNVIIEPATVESDSIESSVNHRQLTNGAPENHPAAPRASTPPPFEVVTPSTFTSTATMTTTTTSTITASSSTTLAWEDTIKQNPAEDDGRQENTLLINRPLSEVLNVRKNLYLGKNEKIPNIETSTHKMRITNSNNLLSSLLNSINDTNSNNSSNNRITSNYVSKNFRNNANVEYDDRLPLGDRGGYSVNGWVRNRFYVNRRTTPALPARTIKEESDEEWSTGDDNSVPEIINLAIIPAFEHEIDEKYIRPHGGDSDHYHRRHRHHYSNAGHPTVHCAMQAVVACVVLGTFFGIAGAVFRSRIIDQLRLLY